MSSAYASAPVTDRAVKPALQVHPRSVAGWRRRAARCVVGGAAHGHLVSHPVPILPRCGSLRTRELSRFGSTACKAQYRCTDCLEPFDHVKEI